MTEADDQVRNFQSLQAQRFDELERFDLTFPIEPPGNQPAAQLTIVLRRGVKIPYPKLVLTFFGIDQLRLEASAYTQFLQLEVRSIRERHWEGLHYLVREAEQGILTFFCNTFEAQILEAPPA